MNKLHPNKLHQQQGGMSMQAFSLYIGLTKRQVLYCVKRGMVRGAHQDSRTKKWWIYPPAKLIELDGEAYTPRKAYKPRAGVIVAMQPHGFDVGTSPHGLLAVLPPSVQETPETVALPLSGRPLLTGVSPGELPVNSWLAMLPGEVKP